MTFIQASRWFTAYDNTGGLTATNSAQTVDLDTAISSEEPYTLASDVVEVETMGLYLIQVDAGVDYGSIGGSVAQGNAAEFEVFVNDTTSLSPVMKVFVAVYNTNVPFSSASGFNAYSLSAGDDLRVKLKRFAASPALSFDTEPEKTRLSIYRVR